jgi:hypothetical protein
VVQVVECQCKTLSSNLVPPKIFIYNVAYSEIFFLMININIIFHLENSKNEYLSKATNIEIMILKYSRDFRAF